MRSARSRILLGLAAGSALTLLSAYAASNVGSSSRPLARAAVAGTLAGAEFRRLTLPARMEIPVTFVSDVAAGRTREGSIVTATIARDVWVDGSVALEEGTWITGRVTASKADGTDTRARLAIELNRIAGRNASIELISPDLESLSRENLRATDARFITGSILLGAILGHEANERRGEIGALLGGLSGAAAAAHQPREIRIRAGERGTIRLTRDLPL